MGGNDGCLVWDDNVRPSVAMLEAGGGEREKKKEMSVCRKERETSGGS